MRIKFNVLVGVAVAAIFAHGATWASEDSHEESHTNEHSGGISYDFFDIAYLDVETHEDDGDGFLIRGAKSLGESFNLFGEYGDAGIHEGDFTFARLGLGYHTSFSDMVDGIAELTYESLELDEPHHHKFDEDGWGFAIGARVLFNEHFEGTARVRYVDFGNNHDDLIVGAELLYLFNHSIGLVAAYEHGNEDVFTFGVRFQF